MAVIAEIEETTANEVPDFDPRVGEEQVDMEPVEELEEIPLSPTDVTRTVKIRKSLAAETK